MTRASHLWLSISIVSRTLCGLPAPWIVTDRMTRVHTDIHTFFQCQEHPILFGTDEPALPRHLVTIATQHGFALTYPRLATDLARMPGLPGPPSHQYRFRQLPLQEYKKLCQLEDAIARDIEANKTMTILPSNFVYEDSVPSRLKKKHVTLSMGEPPVGRFLLLPSNDNACSTT